MKLLDPDTHLALLQGEYVSTSQMELLSRLTLGVAAAWLAWSAFEGWRQRASNLTAVASAPANPNARPGFLDVDHAARGAAVDRGQAYDAKLSAREAEAERLAARATVESAARGSRLAGFAAAAMSVFTLASMVFGACTQIAWMGRYAEDLSAPGRLASIIEGHPYATAAAALVVLFHVYRYVSSRRWSRRA